MAKLTKSGLATFATSYVAVASQGASWSATTNNLYGLIDKIGKIVSPKGYFNDRLPELDGDELPFGKTIEETMIDLVLPTIYGTNGIIDETNATTEGAYDVAPQYPTIETACYNFNLGRFKTKITKPYDYIEAGVNNAEQFGMLDADIMWSLENSSSLTRYALKKQLLANAISKATTAGLIDTLSLPTDTATSEAFIKAVKEDVEDASFASENSSISGTLIGASPELVLFLKKGVMPTLEVEALAGAFNENRLAIPARIVIVDDFGDASANVFALLADTRGIKLHNSYRAIRAKENADGDFVNFVRHEEYTGYISKYTYMMVYSA